MNITFCLESDLRKLADCDAFELIISPSDPTVCYIPYMMNDALECYYKLSGCNIIGQLEKDFSGEYSFVEDELDGKKVLVIRQGYNNTVTIWYTGIVKSIELYQYHRIAHMWVAGEEKWRRLVYIVGTLHDKLNFMGPEFCTKEEIALVEIMRFAPFRYWTPINENLDEYYSDSREGISQMYNIALELKDERLKKKLSRYTKLFTANQLTYFRIWRMAKYIAGNQNLYEFLNNIIEGASLHYKPREYEPDRQSVLDNMRMQCEKEMHSKGFKGEYPHFYKEKEHITAFEEHPYIMQEFEYENYDFKINLVKEK